MVRWWFADYMQTTEHYKRWHPMAHVWMDWENKVPGEIVGASHLVHEYIGDDLSKLRIQFVDAEEFFGPLQEREDQFVLCARVGELEQPLNMATMCHYVRDTPFGAEMRSTFWLGHIAKRNGNDTIFSIEGLLGNTMLARSAMAGEQLANNLMTHAIQEMGNLADFLPQLYAEEANEQRTSSEGDQPSKPRTTQAIDDQSKQSLDDRTGHRPERDGAAIAGASGWPNVAAQDDAVIGQR
jgi:hypothetical protein